MKISAALLAVATMLALTGCTSGPEGGRGEADRDGNGPADGGAAPMDLEDGDDVDQDPVIGAPM